MATVKAHVRQNNTVTVTCPACANIKTIATEKFRKTSHTIKVRCSCKHVFQLQMDFRQHFRKPVNLPGTYAILKKGRGGGVIHIHNISRGGIGFTVSGMHNLQPQQVINLEFHLNDKAQTLIKKEATIRTVINNKIGCQFFERDELGKALGFFLRS
ncbi:PilZ domain-containing protein [Desulfogranum japonicum]|uniref:PilZ domain-containing protein n=1 Tax=Desulfogranum japonicum TaxID=231447 RepID=UPI00041B0B7B|nr:PilZ domain-containing protein [Desulfogranum japonicum]